MQAIFSRKIKKQKQIYPNISIKKSKLQKILIIYQKPQRDTGDTKGTPKPSPNRV
jgi:hypothetical protein